MMFTALQILAVALVATAMALSLAHALELPGKLRLSKEQYLAVQPIYYPGFTIGGAVGELGGLVATLLLLLLTPTGSAAFWLTLGALLALFATHLLYWLVTHPVNNFWLADAALQGSGAAFFASDPFHRRRNDQSGPPDWTVLRDRWEGSHVARAVSATLSLVLLTAAVAM